MPSPRRSTAGTHPVCPTDSGARNGRLQVALVGGVDAGEADHRLHFAQPLDLHDLTEQAGIRGGRRSRDGAEVLVLPRRRVAEQLPLGIEESSRRLLRATAYSRQVRSTAVPVVQFKLSRPSMGRSW